MKKQENNKREEERTEGLNKNKLMTKQNYYGIRLKYIY